MSWILEKFEGIFEKVAEYESRTDGTDSAKSFGLELCMFHMSKLNQLDITH